MDSRLDLLGAFLIKFALSAAGCSCTDNADIIASICMHDNEQFAGKRFSDGDITLLPASECSGSNVERHIVVTLRSACLV